MDQSISSLNLPKNKIAELKKLGYNYCNDVVNFKQSLGLDNIEVLQKGPATKTAFGLLQEEILNGCILSYNEKLDHILKDVVVPKCITELAGESGSGKTQISFQLCISVQLPKWCGGFGAEALYISTNGNFAPHRLRELAKNFVRQYKNFEAKIRSQHDTFSEDFILQHIHYIRVLDDVELMACVKCLNQFLQGKNIQLIIIDSISYPMRLLDPSRRKAVISNLFQELKILAESFNFAIVITNDLTTRVNEENSYVTPSFGDSFYHLVNCRILLSKKNNVFHGKLLKSILCQQKETFFCI